MLTKLLTLSVVALASATVVSSQQLFTNMFPLTEAIVEDHSSDVKNTDWPKVNVPHEFEASARVYLWDKNSKTL